MLAIRLQRTGRSGHAQFRVIVQDSRFSPKRGRVVSYLGNYDPHTKTAVIDSEKAAQYLKNGAQPSDRVARLLKAEGIKLPAWVNLSPPRKGKIRNPDKRRSTRPAGAEAPAPAAEETPAEEPAATDEAQPEAASKEETPQAEKPAEAAAKTETKAPAEEAAQAKPASEVPAGPNAEPAENTGGEQDTSGNKEPQV